MRAPQLLLTRPAPSRPARPARWRKWIAVTDDPPLMCGCADGGGAGHLDCDI